jgi:SSS family solute:Na+ symporter/sodium/pantothenate symporter
LTTNWTILAFLGYILAVYALAAIAHHLSKGKSFIKEYFLGSRSLGPWTLALTLAATSASGGTFTGFPSLIYTYGWVLALWIAGYMVVPLCVMGLLGKRINQVARKSDAVTFPDVFRDRYESPWLGTLTCLLLIFFLAVYLIPQFKAGGVLMQTLFNEVPAFQRFSAIFDGLAENLDGISSGYLAGLAIFTVSVVLYTAYGGFRAVVLTDVMQGLIMGLGITILLPLTLYAAYVYLDPVASSNPRERVQSAATSGKESRAEEPVRFGQLIEGLEKVNGRLAQDDPAALTAPGQKKVETPEGIRFDSFLPLGMAISFFFFWPISGTGQAPNMLRLMAFRDTKTLARSIFTVTIFFGTIYLPLVVIFVAAKTLPLEIEQPDQVMPAITLFVAPPLLAGLLIAAPYAAIMSTVDSFLLMISSSLVCDLYQRSINPDVSEKAMKRISLTTTLLVGFVVMIFAVNPPRFLQDLIVFGSAGQSATFLGAMAMTLYWPRANAFGTACAMIAGFSAVGGMYLIGRMQTGVFEPWTPFDLHPFLWGLFGSLLGGILGSLATAPPSRELMLRYFYREKRQ